MSTIVHSTSKLTYADYATIPADGLRHEIIDGVHFVNAAPSTVHQHVSKRLQYQLYTKIESANCNPNPFTTKHGPRSVAANRDLTRARQPNHKLRPKRSSR